MPDTIDDARRLIESRLAEIDAETKQLGRALDSLGEGSSRRGRRPGRLSQRTGAPTTASPKPKRRVAPKRKAVKRAPRGRRRDELLAAIKATPGARPSELARSIGIRPPQVHALIAKLRAEKLIAKTGDGYTLRAKPAS